MKKILLVFNGHEFSGHLFDFMSEQSPLRSALLTGVFLSPVDYSIVWGYPLPLGGFGDTEVANAELIAENVSKFSALCTERGFEYVVHNEVQDSIAEALKRETRYADLLIVSGNMFYNTSDTDDPGYYMRHTLHEAECPVMILPENFKYPETNLLTYDGSEASVYAIKQFAYLFPEWCARKTYLVYASAKSGEIPDKEYIDELVSRHFPSIITSKLEFNPDKYFNTWVTDEERPMVVTGAYKRSLLSELLKKSFIADTIHDHKFPIFIAHR